MAAERRQVCDPSGTAGLSDPTACPLAGSR